MCNELANPSALKSGLQNRKRKFSPSLNNEESWQPFGQGKTVFLDKLLPVLPKGKLRCVG